jgi:LPXTG-motif cell wall-anchored protein
MSATGGTGIEIVLSATEKILVEEIMNVYKLLNETDYTSLNELLITFSTKSASDRENELKSFLVSKVGACANETTSNNVVVCSKGYRTLYDTILLPLNEFATQVMNDSERTQLEKDINSKTKLKDRVEFMQQTVNTWKEKTAPKNSNQNQTMMWVGVGVAVLLIGGGLFWYKNKNQEQPKPM